MVPMTFIWWIYHFWARFWPYFNFVDFRAYFGPFPHVNRVGRCHPVNLKTDLVEVEDKFVAISYPKTPQRIHFLWKFMPVQTNLLLTLFLDDPVQWYSFLLLHLYTIFTPHPLVQSAFMFRLSEIWLWLHHCWIEFQFGQKREQASLIFCQTWIGNRIELLGYLQKFA